jgi:pimeloyl-ACP methyl ester carboxylesterase
MPVANLPDGLLMYYEDDCFADPWSQPEVVIFHHGQAKSSRLLYGWVPPLAADYRVMRIDARGFGRSSLPEPGYDWSLQSFAADLRNLMDHLGIARAHLVGETIGGTVALEFARLFPERLHSLTICSSPFNFTGVQMYLDYYNLVRDRGVEAWARETSHRRIESGKDGSAHGEWLATEMGRTSQRVVLETLAYLATVDLTPVLPEVRTPALVIVGEKSDSLERSQKLTDLLPNARLALVPGISGFAQFEAPAECAAIWRDFVRSLQPVPSAT